LPSAPAPAAPSASPAEPPTSFEGRATPTKAASGTLSGEEPLVAAPPSIEASPLVSLSSFVVEGAPATSLKSLPSPTSPAVAPGGRLTSHRHKPTRPRRQPARGGCCEILLGDCSLASRLRWAGKPHWFLLATSYQVATKTSSPRPWASMPGLLKSTSHAATIPNPRESATGNYSTGCVVAHRRWPAAVSRVLVRGLQTGVPDERLKMECVKPVLAHADGSVASVRPDARTILAARCA
jgi:hypothetical protein